MKFSQFYISTLREAPSEAVIASHRLMLRASLIRKLGNGLYAYLPLGLRSLEKIKKIVREEWNKIGALEFMPTVILPGEIWKESGRWQTMATQMLTAKNRQGQDMVVSPTAEEAFTAIFRENLSSYKQLPINAYQINTKFRDEIRPRYGVMRGREFLMADGYSMHTSEESLEKTYRDYEKAYLNIFQRLDLKIIPVKANSGAMGGSGSEEFMVESDVGDDTLVLCPKCDYAANVEKAECRADDDLEKVETQNKICEVSTPNVFSILDMEKFFGIPAKNFIKALIYRVINSELDFSDAPGKENLKIEVSANKKICELSYFCVLIRADLEVNEAKLAALLKASDVALADDEEVLKYSGTTHGFVGPFNLSIPILADFTVLKMHDAITGSGKKDFHVKNVEPLRDFPIWISGDVRTVKEGDFCPICGEKLYSKKGNELGHIFKLGKKYTQSMNVSYLDENGKSAVPTMGCYGIGVDRTLASIIEANNDEKGIIWPVTVAPFCIHIVPIKFEGKIKNTALEIYSELQNLGVEVLLDDRDERPGVKFNDADLIGIPIRITIGEKNLPLVEYKLRKQSDFELLEPKKAIEKAISFIESEKRRLCAKN